jgi:hypothetical protein
MKRFRIHRGSVVETNAAAEEAGFGHLPAEQRLEMLTAYDRIDLDDANYALDLLEADPSLWEKFDMAYEIFEDDEAVCLVCFASAPWRDIAMLGDSRCLECGSRELHNYMTTANPLDDGDTVEEIRDYHFDQPGVVYGVWRR